MSKVFEKKLFNLGRKGEVREWTISVESGEGFIAASVAI